MVDVSKLFYRLVLLDEAGKQYDLKDIIQDLGWEENGNELAARVTFKLANVTIPSALELCGNGRMVFLMASVDGAEVEVFRGIQKTRQETYGLSEQSVDCTAYDLLNQLDKSQDNRHISSGRTTQSIFEEITTGWGVTLEEYRGPNVEHGKMDFKNKSPAKMFLELLDDAKKKGAGEFVIRSAHGAIRVQPLMSNQTIYVFGRDNTVKLSCQENIADMVTRVKVLGQSPKEGSAPVEAMVDGRTEFGILQKYYQRDSDETIEAAKQAARELLNEDGVPDEEISLTLPDVPYVRKGDAIYCDRLETADGYFLVLSVNHDCDERSMTVKAKKVSLPQPGLEEERDDSGSFGVGDEVMFAGGTHYVSSDNGAQGYAVNGSGPAKITKVADGKTHPYHLIHSDRSCNVYGWVDKGTFRR